MMVALGLHSNSVELHTLDLSATPPGHTHSSTISAPGHRTDIRYKIFSTSLPLSSLSLRALCFSSDDAFIASGSSKMIKVWSR